MKVAGLFAGVGGIELGLERAGHECVLLCENDEYAKAVLSERLSTVPLHGDVSTLEGLPEETELVTAGFPCQDLSQAGRTEGIKGDQSSLVGHLFRLLRSQATPWVLLENVPFMLQLDGGSGMEYLVTELERLGYRWAYRVVDSRAFGLPQRRRRVYLLASRTGHPASVLFEQDAGAPADRDHKGKACGFYWTEGNTGLGWAVDAIPPLKTGSGLGIPSSPAIWLPDGRIVTPDIRDAERLQGFDADWTLPAEKVGRPTYRWKLVGNAVSVPVAQWIGELISRASEHGSPGAEQLERSGSWPKAAFGSADGRFSVEASDWPVHEASEHLDEFLEYSPNLLSERATAGFLSRLQASYLDPPPEFIEALKKHLGRHRDHVEA